MQSRLVLERVLAGTTTIKSNRALFPLINSSSRSLSTVSDDIEVEPSTLLPQKCKVMICGAGIIGSSVAYNLSKDPNWAGEVICIDQGKVGEGNPWFINSGIVGVLKTSIAETKFAQQSVEMLEDLKNQGLATGWRKCGALNLAQTRDRMTEFRRVKSHALSKGIECQIMTPDEIKNAVPDLFTGDLQGGLWIPHDGIADSKAITLTLVQESRKRGVRFIENCKINKIVQKDRILEGIETDKGSVQCDYFINCAGFWANAVGKLSTPNVKIPLHAVAYHVLVAKLSQQLGYDVPVIRDLDGRVYLRESGGTVIGGGFEKEAKPIYDDENFPQTPIERELTVDWDHFQPLFKNILHRMPILKEAHFDRLSNMPESYSPDGKWMLGEASEIQNYLVAAGTKTVGISASAGVGRVISDIVTKGYSSMDFHNLDITRFLGLHSNRRFLQHRVTEVPGRHYEICYPFPEYKTGRHIRMSPIYPALKKAGAFFGQVMGYERPFYFDKQMTTPDNTNRRNRIAETKTFSKPAYFDLVANEYESCRERIGICDYSSFSKFDIWSKGDEVVKMLQYLCSNDVDVPVGSIIHTGMQNDHGGYENDCSLARISENQYMMIAPTVQQKRCKTWLERHMRKYPTVNLSDVTSMYTAICIIGPFSRNLLAEVTDGDITPKNFPFFSYKELDIGLANGVRIFNLTHTGELGYVLYCPNEFALHVYHTLIDQGQKYGIGHCGYYAMRSLRVEKFYAFWGQDLDTFTTPFECGRAWRIKFSKGDFIGKEALLKQKEVGVTRMYIQLLLDDHDSEYDCWCTGGEPIYRNGKMTGYTTTASYGFTFKTQVCLGFVKNYDENGNSLVVTNDFVLNGDYEVEVAGIRYPAKVHLHSPNLPSKYVDREREAYKATRDSNDDQLLLFKEGN